MRRQPVPQRVRRVGQPFAALLPPPLLPLLPLVGVLLLLPLVLLGVLLLLVLRRRGGCHFGSRESEDGLCLSLQLRPMVVEVPPGRRLQLEAREVR